MAAIFSNYIHVYIVKSHLRTLNLKRRAIARQIAEKIRLELSRQLFIKKNGSKLQWKQNGWEERNLGQIYCLYWPELLKIIN